MIYIYIFIYIYIYDIYIYIFVYIYIYIYNYLCKNWREGAFSENKAFKEKWLLNRIHST